MSGWYRIPGSLLAALCHIIAVYDLSECRYPKKRFVFWGCAFAAGFVGLDSLGYAAPFAAASFFSCAGAVIWTFLFACIVSQGCLPEKCFLLITWFCLSVALDNLLKAIITCLTPYFSALAGYYAAALPRSALLLLILALYQKYAAPAFGTLAGISARRWRNLTLVALLFYLAQAGMGAANAIAALSPALFLFQSVLASLIMCAVYGAIFSNIGFMKQASELSLLRRNAEYLSSQLSVLQNAEEEHRRLRHDIRHHLEAIAGYAKEGDTDGILAYIREYGSDVSETAVRQYSVNRTINAILSAYADKAKEDGIAFSIKCNASGHLPVRDVDLVALLGNLLENALHGCRRSKKGQTRIDIRIREQKGRLTIICDNTCQDDLKLHGGVPRGKGTGISSILAVCRKYNGSLDYIVKDGSCSACAVLNL